MLSHDLATTMVAERDRVIREAVRARRAPARPSAFSRVLGRLVNAMRADDQAPNRRAEAPRRSLARELGPAVPGVSARGGSHGQGAC